MHSWFSLYQLDIVQDRFNLFDEIDPKCSENKFISGYFDTASLQSFK